MAYKQSPTLLSISLSFNEIFINIYEPFFSFIVQVVNREKKFVSATPIPGTIIVNIADLMQRWTADKFVSTVKK